ncbi:hypothetical protein PY310_05310 [Pseudarthrobacter sp. H3Y2-7]|uniref:hypothetical protein n=1 Tax=Pseudarthrobacter naphthalenicus TaxID=3031328 RepID=UPI0023B1D9DE|nr:hypothetical protein [Pseudarthrobacter sp. H3Y2-7]MDE8668001.1 hypothetical protein [Pseudarthrobacter sp. H3Y2-7]
MPQRHDQGWKKQQPTRQPEELPSPEALALDLVRRGLASRQILDSVSPYGRPKL